MIAPESWAGTEDEAQVLSQLPANGPSLAGHIFKKPIGRTLGGQLSQKLCFPSTQ